MNRLNSPFGHYILKLFLLCTIDMASNIVKEGNSVLLLWTGNQNADRLKDTVDRISQKVTDTGSVKVENLDRLQMCKSQLLKIRHSK